MAEHNDGNRGGKDRGNFGGGRNTGGGGFRGTNNSGGDPRGFRPREDRDGEGYGIVPPMIGTASRRGAGGVTATVSRSAVAAIVSRLVIVRRVKAAGASQLRWWRP